MSKTLSPEQFGKLVHLLAENGYAVIPLAAFQGARPVQSAPTPTVEAAPVETATAERKCSYCGESGHNVRTCPKKAADEAAKAQPKPQAKPSAPVQAPAPAVPTLPAFDLDLSDLGSVGVPAVATPAPAPVKSTPAPKAKPTAPAVASKSEIDSELDALFNF